MSYDALKHVADMPVWKILVAGAVPIAFYFTADLGVSTYDAVALIISENWKVGPFKYCRIACDLACVVIGVALFLISGQPVSGLTELAAPDFLCR